MTHEPKVRYSDEELQEFKGLIEDKLAKAEEELDFTQRQIAELNENGFNQQGGDWYDDSSAHTDLEMQQRMAARQMRHIQDLKNALHRIHNKTYGICTVTGQLIDKERLRLVPHATKSVDGKNMVGSREPGAGVEVSGENFAGGEEGGRATPTKPIGDKVRLSNGKRPNAPSGEDWEPDNDTVEDAGYQNRKFEDDSDE